MRRSTRCDQSLLVDLASDLLLREQAGSRQRVSEKHCRSLQCHLPTGRPALTSAKPIPTSTCISCDTGPTERRAMRSAVSAQVCSRAHEDRVRQLWRMPRSIHPVQASVRRLALKKPAQSLIRMSSSSRRTGWLRIRIADPGPSPGICRCYKYLNIGNGHQSLRIHGCLLSGASL